MPCRIWIIQKPTVANWLEKRAGNAFETWNFCIEDVKFVDDAHPCDEDIAKKSNNIIFQLCREIAICKGSRTGLRLSMVQVPVVTNGTSGC